MFWMARMLSITARMWRTASTTLPVPASPFVRIIAAPSLMRRSASPRSRQPLRLVDVVDAQRLEHLRLDEVADADLRHDGDGHRLHDRLDDRRVGHAGDAAGGANVGGDALQGHDGAGAGLLGDPGVLRRYDVHDDAALQHLGKAALDGISSRFDSHWGSPSFDGPRR